MIKDKKCHFCKRETGVMIHSLADVGWSAVSFDDEPKVYACPDHQDKMRDYMKLQIRGSRVNG